ncbi:MAG: hypothetical protein K2M79_04000 [Muribaculaceae bacterium]|nr:hypothetical protein [Muribaculaceae bacterium]
MKNHVWIFVAGVALAVTGLTLVAGSVVMLQDVISPWWQPISVGVSGGLLVTVGTGMLLQRFSAYCRNLPVRVRVLSALVLWLFAASAIMAGLLFWNSYTAVQDGNETHAIVEKRYTKTRYRSRRISRKVYVRGNPYKVYFTDIVFPDGEKATVETNFKSYKALRKSDTVQITRGTGVMGWEVLVPSTLKPLHPSLHLSRPSRHRSARKY